ncbi:MAG: acyl-ACP--UDP-N-acetylglucosamine O-acyltransferase [Candidatus Margulisbacteria bacterium]|nr:acyl-ACP--UDP-N-acetylglucosamine O-acyltransferase [Candidatus Margulisiibacteriota bacterium]
MFTLTEVPSKPNIHPTASVHPSAILGKDVSIGPYSIVGKNVIIGDRTKLEAHVLIEKWTQIGDDCHIHFGAVIGSPPQDTKYEGEKSWVVMGDRNVIREYVTINRSTGKNNITKIGSDCLFLTNVHIAHNCELGDHVIIANATALGGHTIIEDYATIGGITGIHQFVRIGKGSMVGGFTGVYQDIPPFMLCEGNPAYVRGINAIGLKRLGMSVKQVSLMKKAFKLLYRTDLNTTQAVKEIKDFEHELPELEQLVSFLKADTIRGITKKIPDPITDIDPSK